MYPCFLFGCFLKVLWDKYLNHIKAITILSFIIFVPLVCCFNTNGFNESFSAFFSSTFLFENPITALCWRIYRIAMGLSASLFFFGLSFLLFNKPSSSKGISILGLIGAETLGVYVIHAIIIEFILQGHVDMSSLPVWLSDLVISPIISVLIVVGCVLITLILKKNKVCGKYLFGVLNKPKTDSNQSIPMLSVDSIK